LKYNKTSDGQPLLTEIETVGEAKDILEQMGFKVESIGVLPIYTHNWYTKQQEKNGSVHVYFFNKEGNEIAYYTFCMKSMMIFTTPRIWSQEFKDQIEPYYI
jgi:hypothetical protein